MSMLRVHGHKTRDGINDGSDCRTHSNRNETININNVASNDPLWCSTKVGPATAEKRGSGVTSSMTPCIVKGRRGTRKRKLRDGGVSLGGESQDDITDGCDATVSTQHDDVGVDNGISTNDTVDDSSDPEWELPTTKRGKSALSKKRPGIIIRRNKGANTKKRKLPNISLSPGQETQNDATVESANACSAVTASAATFIDSSANVSECFHCKLVIRGCERRPLDTQLSDMHTQLGMVVKLLFPFQEGPSKGDVFCNQCFQLITRMRKTILLLKGRGERNNYSSDSSSGGLNLLPYLRPTKEESPQRLQQQKRYQAKELRRQRRELLPEQIERNRQHREEYHKSREPLLDGLTSQYDLDLFRKEQMREAENMDPCPVPSTTPKYICPYCQHQLASRQSLHRHKQRVHPADKKKEPTNTPIQCYKCNIFRCGTIKELIRHLNSVHGTTHLIQHAKLQSEEEFLEWKSELEKRHDSWFVKSRGKNKCLDYVTQYYYCNRSGVYKGKGAGKRDLKSQGSSKIQRNCSAFLKCTTLKANGAIEVEYCVDHDHPTQIAHLQMSDELRSFVVGKLASGVDSKVLLAKIRDNMSKLVGRDKLVTHRDILNIKNQYNISSANRDENDSKK